MYTRKTYTYMFYAIVAILISAILLTVITSAEEDFDPQHELFGNKTQQAEIWELVAPGITFGGSLLIILLGISIAAGIGVITILGIIANAKHDVEGKRQSLNGLLHILMIVLLAGIALSVTIAFYHKFF